MVRGFVESRVCDISRAGSTVLGYHCKIGSLKSKGLVVMIAALATGSNDPFAKPMACCEGEASHEEAAAQLGLNHPRLDGE